MTPDKLFRLDPVETKITKPVSQFQLLAQAADRSIANRSLARGFKSFSQALGGLAEFRKEEQPRMQQLEGRLCLMSFLLLKNTIKIL